MGIFGSIKNAIWGSDEEERKADATAATPAATPKPAASAAPAMAATPEPISEEQMAERISKMPGADRYNWRTSVVDLMKMVGVDPSFANRKELAEELGMTDYEGTAEQNINLHHAVLNMLAAEGGKMPSMLKS